MKNAIERVYLQDLIFATQVKITKEIDRECSKESEDNLYDSCSLSRLKGLVFMKRELEKELKKMEEN